MKDFWLTLLTLVALLHGAWAQPADLIRYGQTIQGGIGTLGESDRYYFSAEAGDRLLIPILAVGGNLEPLVVLYSPAGPPGPGARLAQAASPGLGWDSKLIASVSGEYTIEVRDMSNRTGPYALSLFCLNKANTADEGRTQIVPGRSIRVDIAPGDYDMLEFEGAIGETFVAVALKLNQREPAPVYSIYRPEGDLLLAEPFETGNRWFGWGYNRESGGAIRIGKTGTHRIVYGMRSVAAQHSAGFTLLKHPWPNVADPDGGELLPGGVKSGELVGGDVDSFFFYGAAGDVVDLRMPTAGSSARYPAMWILDPHGRSVANPTGSVQASVENLRLSATGYYLVICYSWLAYSANYAVAFSGSMSAPPMNLHFTHLGDTHQVFWLDRDGWQLQRSDSDGSGPWHAEPRQTLSMGGFRTLNLPTSMGARFYRLTHP
ncbi:MAG: hypothetical protein KF833_12140 [Verrucomicrobiae bacterium]|nr:hypothetical protein [Verrucomicrobiae bacterium]